jgi:hypothetical protein
VLSVMSGWDVHTGILADVLNGTEPRPFWTTHSRLEKEYATALWLTGSQQRAHSLSTEGCGQVSAKRGRCACLRR